MARACSRGRARLALTTKRLPLIFADAIRAQR